MVFGVMIGLAGIIMLICAAVLALKQRSFRACSEPVTAQVTEKHSRHGKNGKIYELKVAYQVNGIEYQRYLRTAPQLFNSLTEGDPLELLYKPQNPKNVILPDALERGGLRKLLLIGLVMTAVGVAMYLLG